MVPAAPASQQPPLGSQAPGPPVAAGRRGRRGRLGWQAALRLLAVPDRRNRARRAPWRLPGDGHTVGAGGAAGSGRGAGSGPAGAGSGGGGRRRGRSRRAGGRRGGARPGHARGGHGLRGRGGRRRARAGGRPGPSSGGGRRVVRCRGGSAPELALRLGADPGSAGPRRRLLRPGSRERGTGPDRVPPGRAGRPGCVPDDHRAVMLTPPGTDEDRRSPGDRREHARSGHGYGRCTLFPPAHEPPPARLALLMLVHLRRFLIAGGSNTTGLTKQ
jgi:hypothetical protein